MVGTCSRQETGLTTPSNGRSSLIGLRGVRNLSLKGVDSTKILCREVCRPTFLVQPSSHLLLWDSTFQPAAENVAFGDWEKNGSNSPRGQPDDGPAVRLSLLAASQSITSCGVLKKPAPQAKELGNPHALDKRWAVILEWRPP